MKIADSMGFSVVMVMLGDAFDAAPSAEKIDIYFEALRCCSLESVQWAAKEAVKRCQFFPRAKELLDLAGMAPRSTVVEVTGRDAVQQLEILTPPEEARAKLAEMAARFNDEMGTSFVVGEELGRPKLVSIRGGKS